MRCESRHDAGSLFTKVSASRRAFSTGSPSSGTLSVYKPWIAALLPTSPPEPLALRRTAHCWLCLASIRSLRSRNQLTTATTIASLPTSPRILKIASLSSAKATHLVALCARHRLDPDPQCRWVLPRPDALIFGDRPVGLEILPGGHGSRYIRRTR